MCRKRTSKRAQIAPKSRHEAEDAAAATPVADHRGLDSKSTVGKLSFVLEWLNLVLACRQRRLANIPIPTQPHSTQITSPVSSSEPFYYESSFSEAIDMLSRRGSNRPQSWRRSRDGRSKVEQPNYRDGLLRKNGIETILHIDKTPLGIQNAIKAIFPQEKMGLYIKELEISPVLGTSLYRMMVEGCQEEAVKMLVQTHLFGVQVLSPPLHRISRASMDTEFIPNPAGSNFQISRPIPDTQIDYSQESFISAGIQDLYAFDSNQCSFSFLSTEYKGDGPISGGKLWAATNKCLGATATNLSIINGLLKRMPAEEQKTIDPLAFRLVTNGVDARLFVTYSPAEGKIHMAPIRAFHLYDVCQFKQLSWYIDSTMKWGETRFDLIKNALCAMEGIEQPGTPLDEATEAGILKV